MKDLELSVECVEWDRKRVFRILVLWPRWARHRDARRE